MRMHCLVAVAVAILLAAPATAQSPANAVWATDDQNRVYRWDPARREFGFVPGSINMKQVSVGADGEVWGVDPLDNAYRWTGAQWQAIPARLRQVSVRSRSEVWAINPDGQLFRRNAAGTGWDPVDTPGGIRHVAAAGDGSVWMVDGAGNLAQRENNGWKPVPCLITSGVLRRDGTTWTITRSIEDPSPSPGVPCAPDRLKLKKVWATDAQKIFGVNERGDLVRLTGTGWYFFESGRSDVAYSSDGELWITSGSVFFSKDQMASWDRMQPFNVAFQSIAVGAAAASPPTPPSAAAGGSGMTPEQEQAVLQAHNAERQQLATFGVQPLQWSPELAALARDWAQQQVVKTSAPSHRPSAQLSALNPLAPGAQLGENIAWGWPVDELGVPASYVVDVWIAEKQYYHHDRDDGNRGWAVPPGCTPPPGGTCGHYTQVVWKTTQRVGCGMAVKPSTEALLVCNYYPLANVPGVRAY